MVFQEGKLNTEYWKEMTTLIIDFLLSCKNLGIQCAITIQNKTNFWMLWMSCDNCTLFGYLSPGYASFCWPYKVVNWKHGIHIQIARRKGYPKLWVCGTEYKSFCIRKWKVYDLQLFGIYPTILSVLIQRPFGIQSNMELGVKWMV